jgi:hypothetical protein
MPVNTHFLRTTSSGAQTYLPPLNLVPDDQRMMITHHGIPKGYAMRRSLHQLAPYHLATLVMPQDLPLPLVLPSPVPTTSEQFTFLSAYNQ